MDSFWNRNFVPKQCNLLSFEHLLTLEPLRLPLTKSLECFRWQNADKAVLIADQDSGEKSTVVVAAWQPFDRKSDKRYDDHAWVPKDTQNV